MFLYKKISIKFLLVASAVAAFVMPLPRIICWDHCEWYVASMLLPHSMEVLFNLFFVSTIGIVLIVPIMTFGGLLVSHTVIYFILFFPIAWLLNKNPYHKNKTRIIVFCSVAILATLVINIFYVRTFSPVREFILTEYNRFFLIKKFTIGMNKEEALAISPDAVQIKKYASTDENRYIDFLDTDDDVPNPFGNPNMGSDCVKIGHVNLYDGVTLCFFKNKLYTIQTYTAGSFGDLENEILVVHDDYEQTVKNMNFATPDICENADQFPYYMGEMDMGVCNVLVARETQNISLCNKASQQGFDFNACLIDVVKQTGNVETCKQIKKTDSKFRDELDFEECVSIAAVTKNDVAICDVLQDSSEHYLRCIGNVILKNSRTDLCGQLASLQIKNKRYGPNTSQQDVVDVCLNNIKSGVHADDPN